MRKTLKSMLTSILAGVVLGVTTLSTLATDYYVNLKGDDSSDGKTHQSAWQTLKKIRGFSFEPGDRIFLKRGQIFNGTLETISSGTLERMIGFEGYGDEKEKVRIVSADKNPAIAINSKSFIYFKDLSISSLGRGVLSEPGTGSNNIIFDGLEVDASESGFGLYNIQDKDISVINCTIRAPKDYGIIYRGARLLANNNKIEKMEGKPAPTCGICLEGQNARILNNAIDFVKTGILIYGSTIVSSNKIIRTSPIKDDGSVSLRVPKEPSSLSVIGNYVGGSFSLAMDISASQTTQILLRENQIEAKSFGAKLFRLNGGIDTLSSFEKSLKQYNTGSRTVKPSAIQTPSLPVRPGYQAPVAPGYQTPQTPQVPQTVPGQPVNRFQEFLRRRQLQQTPVPQLNMQTNQVPRQVPYTPRR